MKRRTWGSAALSVLAAAALVWICATHSADVGTALAAVPAWGFAAAVALHIGTLVLRSEAWRLTLASIEGDALPRRVVHGANAAAFLAGAAQSQAALPARVALLRRMAGSRAPRPTQICMADVPIFAIELVVAAALLLAAGVAGLVAPWVAPAALVLALAVLLAARRLPQRFAHRPMVRGLAVLADRSRRWQLLALATGLSALTIARIWLILIMCALPHGLGQVAWLSAALGGFGLLPLGPGAPPSATLAALGTADVGGAVAAGLVIGVSSIAAVFVYGLGVGVAVLGERVVAAERPVPAR